MITKSPITETIEIVFPDGSVSVLNAQQEKTEEPAEVITEQPETPVVLPEIPIQHLEHDLVFADCRNNYYDKYYRVSASRRPIVMRLQQHTPECRTVLFEMKGLREPYKVIETIIPFGYMSVEYENKFDRAFKAHNRDEEDKRLINDLGLPEDIDAATLYFIDYSKKIDSKTVVVYEHGHRKYITKTRYVNTATEDLSFIRDIELRAALDAFVLECAIPKYVPMIKRSLVTRGSIDVLKSSMFEFIGHQQVHKFSNRVFLSGFMTLGMYTGEDIDVSTNDPYSRRRGRTMSDYRCTDPNYFKMIFALLCDSSMLEYIMCSMILGLPITPSVFTLVVATELLDKEFTDKAAEEAYAVAYKYATAHGIPIVETTSAQLTDMLFPVMVLPPKLRGPNRESELKTIIRRALAKDPSLTGYSETTETIFEQDLIHTLTRVRS